MSYTGDGFKLKKLLVTIICVLFFAHVHSQSLSAKELVNLLDNTDKSDFLKSRSFTVLGSDMSEKGISQHFQKNQGRDGRETIVVTSTLVSYLTNNKSYINNLLNQLKQHFKQLVNDDNAETSYYLFMAGQGKKISINISKKGSSYYSLEVVQK